MSGRIAERGAGERPDDPKALIEAPPPAPVPEWPAAPGLVDAAPTRGGLTLEDGAGAVIPPPAEAKTEGTLPAPPPRDAGMAEFDESGPAPTDLLMLGREALAAAEKATTVDVS